jgi:3-dehydroquinate synthase
MRLEYTDTKKCDISAGESLLDKAAAFAQKQNKRLAVITDSNIDKLYGQKIKTAFSDPFTIVIPAGEKSKTRKGKEKIENALLENHFGKDTVMIAIGGGVTTDLAGFVASTFCRGIPYINMPTSLLGMCDASIGGKTGANTQHGKNIIGTIWQPLAVFADIDFLNTLPKKEFTSGLAEVVKISLASDRQLFEFIEENHKKILGHDKDILLYMVTKGIRLKKEVVEKDPDERGLRQILNLGHTIGHGIESASGFRIRHGYCVSIGIVVEAKISVMLGILDKAEGERINSLLSKLGLPVTLPEVSDGLILERIVSDKKTKGFKPHFVLLEKIGKVKSSDGNYSYPVDDKIIIDAMRQCR